MEKAQTYIEVDVGGENKTLSEAVFEYVCSILIEIKLVSGQVSQEINV